MVTVAERHEAVALRRNIRLFRVHRGLSQRALADRVGINRSAVGAYENGLAFPSVETLLRIADALGVPVSRLFEETRL